MKRTAGLISAEMTNPTVLPVGVRVRPLLIHRDHRGALTEIYRASWWMEIAPGQWNFVQSVAGALRGVHVHVRHVDYIVALQGRAGVGLCDLRPGSPTEGVGALIDVGREGPAALTIPPGVAHGILAHEPAIFAYAVSEYWDLADEIACHWSDPALAIPWPIVAPSLSERDAGAPPVAAIRGLIPPYAGS
jgi:dTDP-4-dehydrorhamnose 3,5-epimerase